MALDEPQEAELSSQNRDRCSQLPQPAGAGGVQGAHAAHRDRAALEGVETPLQEGRVTRPQKNTQQRTKSMTGSSPRTRLAGAPGGVHHLGSKLYFAPVEGHHSRSITQAGRTTMSVTATVAGTTGRKNFAENLIRDAIVATLHRKLAELEMAQACLICTAHDPHEMVETLRPVVWRDELPDSMNNRAMAKLSKMADWVLADRARQRAESY